MCRWIKMGRVSDDIGRVRVCRCDYRGIIVVRVDTGVTVRG